MGIGFVIVIILLAVLLGMFSRQALANVDNGSRGDKPLMATDVEVDGYSEDSDWNAI